MALTTKPISTITYNTDEYLKSKLEELHQAKKIEKYYAIKHDKDVLVTTGEQKKTHWHVWIQPNTRIDTMALANEFTEVDPNNPNPLKCRPFQKSVLHHWLRYTIHDPIYLTLHGDDNDGRHEYDLADYLAFDDECLSDDYLESACVLEMDKKQQRDVIADFIQTSTEKLDTTLIYQYAKERNLMEGYWAYLNALARIIYDHNKALELNQDMTRMLDKIRAEDYSRISLKMDEVDVTGFARIKDNQGQEYIVTKVEKRANDKRKNK